MRVVSQTRSQEDSNVAQIEHDSSQGAVVDESVTKEQSLQDQRDLLLVRRLKAGDEHAFKEMVDTYQGRIFNLTLRMLGNREEAEDLAQEVFLTVFRAIDRYRGEGRFYTWLYRIASNTCKNRLKYLKGRQYHTNVALEDELHTTMDPTRARQNLQSEMPDPEALVRGQRLQRGIQQELLKLDPEHRLLIVLRDIQGHSYQEIMRITGLQEGTLKSRLHRARVSLKENVEKYLQ